MAGMRKTLKEETEDLMGQVMKMKLRAHQEGDAETKKKMHTIEQVLLDEKTEK